MRLCARSSLWLLGLVAACRYGYDELGPNDLGGGASSGGNQSGQPSTAGTLARAGEANVAGDAGAPGLGGDGAQTGGTTQTAAMGGQAGTVDQGGSVALGGAPDCPDSIELMQNLAPTVAPPVTCAYPGALVCDDFESGQLPYWTVITGAPAGSALQTCLTHGGTHALWARPSGTAAAVQLQEQLSPTVGTGSLFMRTFVYLPSSAALPMWTVLYEVWDSPTKWTNKISVDLQPDGSVTLNNWAGGGQQNTTLTSPTALLPRDQWTCMELEIVVDKINGATRLYLDDAQVVTSTGAIRTRGTRSFCTVSIGASASGELPVDVYQDDFVVATQRIGCN